MIVCHCHAVTDREIKACVQSGAHCPDDVAERCGATSACGGCASLVEEIVQGERRRLSLYKTDSQSAFAELRLQSA